MEKPHSVTAEAADLFLKNSLNLQLSARTSSGRYKNRSSGMHGAGAWQHRSSSIHRKTAWPPYNAYGACPGVYVNFGGLDLA
jgi:hypothetical protein